jgi:hypothetical protein
MPTSNFGTGKARLNELARLLGGRSYTANGYYSVRCPAHDDTHASASIWLGSDGRVRAKCFARCHQRAIIAEIALRTGMVSADGTFLTAATPLGTLAKPSPADIEAEIAEAQRAVKAMQRAEQTWLEAKPVTEDDLVARYLRETRGLAPPRIPVTLRHCAYLWHGWTRSAWPAMLARVVGAEGEVLGLHRTWLDGHTARKAPVQPDRAALGPIGGGAIRLWEVPGSADLLIAEGIETTLAAAQLADWKIPSWAAISTAGMEGLIVPARFKRVLIAADNDKSGLKAAKTLAQRLRWRGLRAVIKAPPAEGEDWNDVALARRSARWAASARVADEECMA